jgi:hypothetical protein
MEGVVPRKWGLQRACGARAATSAPCRDSGAQRWHREIPRLDVNVIPANAGIHRVSASERGLGTLIARRWIPAFAGMTNACVGMTGSATAQPPLPQRSLR